MWHWCLNFFYQTRVNRVQDIGQKQGLIRRLWMFVCKTRVKGDKREYSSIKWEVAWATRKLFLARFSAKTGGEQENPWIYDFLNAKAESKKNFENFLPPLLLYKYFWWKEWWISPNDGVEARAWRTGTLLFFSFSFSWSCGPRSLQPQRLWACTHALPPPLFSRYASEFFMKAMDLIDCMIEKKWFPLHMMEIYIKMW